MTYNQESQANARMIASALLAVSAGACVGVALSYSQPLSSLSVSATQAKMVATAPLNRNAMSVRVQAPAPAMMAPEANNAFGLPQPEGAVQNPTWVGIAFVSVVMGVAGAVVAMFRKPKMSLESYAMLAATGESTPVWTVPKLADALQNEKARKKAEAMSTQLPTFWEVRDDLGKVPKSEFPNVFASYKGSTGTLLSAAKKEEYHAITWTSPKAQIYELPTGGAAMMDEGLNIMYFARKEQCLALGTQLRTKFKPRIENYAIYRVFPNGETQYLHPKDGVFPEKVNAGRSMANHNPRSIGKNVEPASVKFSGTDPKDMANAVAMMAASGEKAAEPEKPVWKVPSLADAMADTAAVEKAKAMATQLPNFWELRDALGKVPKSEFDKVFAANKGSTGTLLAAASKEEKYVITWTSTKKQIYELPTGGAAEMDAGRNIMFFARKEQCLALGAQLRTAFKPRIEDFQIYRVFPNGEAQYLHPKDGVFPEKVNEGRLKANHNPRSIGDNVEPASVKFSGTDPKDVATEGRVAMFAESGEKVAEKAPWQPPSLADIMKNEAAVAKAKAMSTQLPNFWDLRDALGKVPKSEFDKVFAANKGSTGTLLAAASKEEKYVISWTSTKKQIYELPTGGAAEMDEGENVMFFARKEQCLALGAQLRTAFKPRIENYKIFRVFPNGEAQYLHPKDGVFPEKVNEGRLKANHNPRSIGDNVEPASVKFSGTDPKDVATEGRVAMMAATAEKQEKGQFQTPNLADAMTNKAAVAKAEAMTTQLPTFWEVRDDLSKVPKPEFDKVFASYKGSTGTLLSAASTEEKYVITWTSTKKQIYELPTGGAAEMDEGENIMFFARKEQCLALGAQLRTAFKPRIEDFKIYRAFPNGEVQYLHPKDGVFPEKVNEGRQQANHNARSIGNNVEPAAVKFSGAAPKDL